MTRPTHGGNLTWAARLAGCSPREILDFSASINPLGPPQRAITALEEGLKSITAYPDPNYSQLRSALGEYHDLPPAWILPGNGAAELLTWAARELSSSLATYLLTPAFSDYGRALRAFAANIESCPLSLSQEQVKLNFPSGRGQNRGLLINNPHNPTGKLFSREALLPYLDSYTLVVVDEAFMDFLPPSQQQSLISEVEKYPNLVVLRSLTKFYSLPGLRLGYAVAHPEGLQRWQQWRDPWSVNILAAKAGEAVIGDHHFQQRTWQWLPAAREELFLGLNSLPGLTPLESAANFLLVRTEIASSELQKQLLAKRHILIRDCLSFPELGDAYFRVAVRSSQENQQLLAALAEISAK